MTIWELATKTEKPERCELCNATTYAEMTGRIICNLCERAICHECIDTYVDGKTICEECAQKGEEISV